MHSNVITFQPSDPNPGFGLHLSLGRELAQALWGALRIKVTPAILCKLRKEGLPYVRLSERHFRYEIPVSLEWMLMRSAKNNFMTPSNVLKLTSKINEDNSKKGA